MAERKVIPIPGGPYAIVRPVIHRRYFTTAKSTTKICVKSSKIDFDIIIPYRHTGDILLVRNLLSDIYDIKSENKENERDVEFCTEIPTVLGYTFYGSYETLTDLMKHIKKHKKWKGEKAALAWIRKIISESTRDASTQYIYQEKQFELLWSLVKNPQIEYAWLMRAAASLQYKELKKKDRKKLIQYYQSAKGDWDLAGKYLLGMVSEEEFIKRSKPAFTRGVYAFYLGLKAETEGRLEEASDWYRVSMETGWYQVTEYHWAVRKLEKWERQNRFLALLDLNQD